MLSTDTFNASSTDVKVNCPSDMSGLERILITAQGNLQRLLSTFFGKPIHIECVYSRTGPRVEPASEDRPVRQDRQVLLKCGTTTVCIATSTVIITSPEVERLFLEEKYPIGQLFRKLGVTPEFTLLNVQVVYDAGLRELERTYKLSTEGVVCTILEVFPDRDIFVHGLPESSESTADEFEETPVREKDASLDETIAPSFASEDFYTHIPHSPATTLTLSSILDKQAFDEVVGRKVFAAYPYITDEEASYREITYSELAQVVNYEASLWAKSLQPIVGAGNSADSPIIAVLGDSGFDYAVTVLALLKLNVSVFVLAPANSEAAVKHLLSTTDVSAMIYTKRHTAVGTSASFASKVPALAYEDTKSFQYDDVISGVLSSASPKPLRDSPPEVPIIVHSSGSTAFPKPVRWSNTSFLSNSQVLLSEGGWSVFTEPDNRFLCLGPLFHTLGLTIGLANTICAGTTIVFPLTRAWPPSPTDIANSFRATQVTTCIIVPLLLEQLVGVLEDTGSLEILSSLRLLLTGGAHCPKSLAHRLIKADVNLKCIYGSSETGHMMVGSHDRSTAREDSWDLLRPFPNTSIIFKPLESDSGMENMYQVHMAPSDVRLAPNTIRDGASTWNTGDVVEESPAGSGWYRLLYRDDDILVHVSGEKTNPIPMEITCRDHKLIDSVAIIGHQRRVTAAVVQLDEAYGQRFSESERTAMVNDAIDAANQEAPSHSRVLHEMVFVIPFGYHKQMPKTPKGNCIRPKVLQLFGDEIDALYRNFEDDGESDISSSPASSATTVVDVQSQALSILEDVVGHQIKSSEFERSLFDMGLDSVKAMQLRTRLARFFDTKLPQKFIYQNFTLALLSAALWQRVSSRTNTPLAPSSPQSPTLSLSSSKGDILQSLINSQVDILKNSANLLKASRLPGTASTAPGQVVAIVGAAGSLGVWQVKALLDQPDVRQVVCLVRGKDAAAVYDKMSKGFENASMGDLVELCKVCKEKQLSQPKTPATNLDQRLAVVPFDLADAQFDQTEYYALATSLTTIIHTGWKMDFNQVVQGFEDCINGTTRLLILAAFLRPKHFYFISSIGTVLESLESPVPETLPAWTKEDYVRASPHGYSESKFVCEYVVKAASELLDIPCSMARIGQIAGDSISGAWKVQEMNPIIIAGSARIGQFPTVPGAIMDWIPVDAVGYTTAELATAKQPTASVSINHIVSPSLSTYGEMIEQLRETGLDLKPTAPGEWWKAIQQDEGNPCLAIEGYIEEAVVEALEKLGDKTSVTLDISNTLSRSRALANASPIDSSLWKKYVNYWKAAGFIL